MTVDHYKEQTARLDIDDIDFAAFEADPLDPTTLRCLRYMHDVENHTICYLRDLLVTRAHQDPEITTFLTLWAFEEFWHGDAIAQILHAHGELAGDDRVRALRSQLRWRDRFAPLIHGVVSAAAGPSFTAVHMTWGAVNEWTTQAGYARLGAQSPHPVLKEVLSRIMRQEGRHIDFYATQAEQRLTDDPRAQKLTRFALKHLWQPVGAGVMPPSEVAFLINTLFGDEAGREAAARIDRRVDRLPGLAGLNLIGGAVNEHRPAISAPTQPFQREQR